MDMIARIPDSLNAAGNRLLTIAEQCRAIMPSSITTAHFSAPAAQLKRRPNSEIRVERGQRRTQ